MAALTVYDIKDAGTAPTFSDAAASQTVDIGNGKNTFLVVKNGSASSVDVTISGQGETTYGEDMPDHKVTVAASGEAWIPIHKAYDPGDGTNAATVATSAQTTVTLAAVRALW